MAQFNITKARMHLSELVRMAMLGEEVVIANPDNGSFLSLVSSWEMAIKLNLGKLKLPGVIERFVPQQLAENGFSQLPIDFRHVARVAGLAFHHRDPFDRLLAAQAIEENLTIVSADRLFVKYGVQRVW